MDMGLDTYNSNLKYELCGIIEEKNGRSVSGIIDEHNLVGVEYNGEYAEFKLKIEIELLEFLRKNGVMTSFVEAIDDDVLIFEKLNKGNISTNFSYIYNKTNGFRFIYKIGGEDNGSLEDKVWHINSKLASLIKEFFDKIGIKIFSGKLQIGFNHGQRVINGINVNDLSIGDHLVLQGEDGKNYIDGNYSEEELNGIGGKHSSYWRNLQQIPDDILIERIITYKSFNDSRMEELVKKIEQTQEDEKLVIKSTKERVIRLFSSSN